MPATVRVRGARELRAALKQAGADLGQLTKVHRAVARIVQGRAAADAPRRTGTLARQLRTRANRTRASVTSRTPYAGVVHWGWPRRGIAANPFAQRAAQATEPQWTREYRAEIERIVRRVDH